MDIKPTEKEALLYLDLIDSEGWKLFEKKIMELVKDIEDDILSNGELTGDDLIEKLRDRDSVLNIIKMPKYFADVCLQNKNMEEAEQKNYDPYLTMKELRKREKNPEVDRD